MNHDLRPLFLRVFFSFVAGILSFSAVSRAQSQDQPAPTEKAPPSSAPQKPVHKPHMVITNDSIAHLAVPRLPRTVDPPPAVPETAAAKELPATADDATQRKAEIAALEKQIKDKQRRVELLMRLFVADEQSFLKNPLNLSADPATKERLRYEQDELHWEAAEVARLRVRLDALKPATQR